MNPTFGNCIFKCLFKGTHQCTCFGQVRILCLMSTLVSSTHEFLLSLSEIRPTGMFPQKHTSSPQSHIYGISNQVPITVIVTPAVTHKGPATQAMHIYK